MRGSLMPGPWRPFLRRNERTWSIARRLFGISLLLILLQAFISSVLTVQLRKHFLRQFLDDTLSRQIVAPFNVISDRLDQLSVDQLFACCTINDYRNWIEGLILENGKAGMITGSAGLQTIRGANRFYDEQQLLRYARKATSSATGFAMDSGIGESSVAIKSVKLPGGPETGFFVYVRPVYSMPLVNMLIQIKLISELILMLVLALALLISLRLIFRPVRRVQEELASIELNHLEKAALRSEHQPREFQPLLEEFNRMVERLRRSSANQKQFASTISHEFRTPMTVISGFIQSVLNRDQTLQPQFRDALALANREVLRLNRMLSDLLDLSRADNNQLKVLREPFDCLASLREARRHSQIAYPDRAIKFADPSADQQVWAVGDADRLVQCLENLIGNAVKYSEPATDIELELDVQDHFIVFRVIDHGQGIADDQLERIFERFQRADGVTLRRGDSSSGLGLSIVKMLMNGMGGSVRVQSKAGSGSCFMLVLQRSGC
mgnify:FL=1